MGNSNKKQNTKLDNTIFNGPLPSVDEAAIAALKISESVEPKLTAEQESFLIAGFCECIKWLENINTNQGGVYDVIKGNMVDGKLDSVGSLTQIFKEECVSAVLKSLTDENRP